jgi:hypothetical protein
VNRCEYFKTFLNDPFNEIDKIKEEFNSANEQKSVLKINLNEISKEVFIEIINFIYSNEFFSEKVVFIFLNE